MSVPAASGEYLTDDVHRAIGMISVQAQCDVGEALGRLRIRADAISRTLHDTAVYVIDGVIRFDE